MSHEVSPHNSSNGSSASHGTSDNKTKFDFDAAIRAYEHIYSNASGHSSGKLPTKTTTNTPYTTITDFFSGDFTFIRGGTFVSSNPDSNYDNTKHNPH